MSIYVVTSGVILYLAYNAYINLNPYIWLLAYIGFNPKTGEIWTRQADLAVWLVVLTSQRVWWAQGNASAANELRNALQHHLLGGFEDFFIFPA